MADVEPLATPADLATRLARSADDPMLLLALKRAGARFEAAVGYSLRKVTDDEETLDPQGDRYLLLPAAPVLSVAQVTVGGQVVTDWSLSRKRAALFRETGWGRPERLGSIVVTYSHGFDPIPEDVQDVVLEQAELQFNAPAGLQQLAQGGRSATFSTSATTGVTARWAEAVDRYSIGRGDRSR